MLQMYSFTLWEAHQYFYITWFPQFSTWNCLSQSRVLRKPNCGSAVEQKACHLIPAIQRIPKSKALVRIATLHTSWNIQWYFHCDLSTAVRVGERATPIMKQAKKRTAQKTAGEQKDKKSKKTVIEHTARSISSFAGQKLTGIIPTGNIFDLSSPLSISLFSFCPSLFESFCALPRCARSSSVIIKYPQLVRTKDATFPNSYINRVAMFHTSNFQSCYNLACIRKRKSERGRRSRGSQIKIAGTAYGALEIIIIDSMGNPNGGGDIRINYFYLWRDYTSDTFTERIAKVPGDEFCVDDSFNFFSPFCFFHCSAIYSSWNSVREFVIAPCILRITERCITSIKNHLTWFKLWNLSNACFCSDAKQAKTQGLNYYIPAGRQRYCQSDFNSKWLFFVFIRFCEKIILISNGKRI